MTSSPTSSIMAEKNPKWPIYCEFWHFISIINLTLWAHNLKSCSCFLLNFVMHVTLTSSRTSSIMAEKKIKMADLL